MKKTLFTILFSCILAAGAWAQSMNDALFFSNQNLYGTARSVALGNAMTALGGDLGSVTINPAGSAIGNYSQFTITPNVSLVTTNNGYAPIAGAGITDWNKSSYSRFSMPNLGVIVNFDVADAGLKRMSFGILSNASNNHLNRVNVWGVNDFTSITGALAVKASDLNVSADVLNDASAYNQFGGGYWDVILGRRATLIESFDGVNNYYAGAAENIGVNPDGSTNIYTGGPLSQEYYRFEYGYKHDLVFNFGMNFSDKFFLGVNLGVPTFAYHSKYTLSETAVDPGDFETGLVDASYTYTYDAQGEGIYAKVGFIWLPVPGLRIGAAAQSPTMYNITDVFRLGGSTKFLSGGSQSGSDLSPKNEYSYNLCSPAITSVGFAYTFGGFGLISADWERTYYRGMYLSDVDPTWGRETFKDANADIARRLQGANAFRVGAEVKLSPEFALRGGWTWKGDPEYGSAFTTQSYSAGLGYSSPGSFFLDLAARLTEYPAVAYYPYADYVDGYRSMSVDSNRKLADFVLTLGWRF